MVHVMYKYTTIGLAVLVGIASMVGWIFFSFPPAESNIENNPSLPSEPIGWANYTWKSGVYEADYYADYENCSFLLDRHGANSTAIHTGMEISCQYEYPEERQKGTGLRGDLRDWADFITIPVNYTVQGIDYSHCLVSASYDTSPHAGEGMSVSIWCRKLPEPSP